MHPGIRITGVSIDDFNKWIASSHRKAKPFADYSNVKATDDIRFSIKEVPEITEADKVTRNALVNVLNNEIGIYTSLDEEEEQMVLDMANSNQAAVRYNEIKSINTNFNNELQQQIEGKLEKGHVYQIGTPSNILLSADIPNLPIEVAASRLELKSSKDYENNHPYDLKDLQDLPDKLQEPIAVFNSKNKAGSKVILLELKDRNGNNFVVALKTNVPKNKFGNGTIQINDIRSIYPKDNINDVVSWINRGDLLLYADKKKIETWITQQRSNSAEVEIQNLDIAAKIVKNFNNPKLSDINLREQRVFHGSGSSFNEFDSSHIGEGEGAQAHGWGHYVAVDEKTGKGYAKRLGKEIPTWKGYPIDSSIVNGKDTPLRAAYDALVQEGTMPKAKAFIERIKGYAETDEMKNYWSDVLDILNQSKKSDFNTKTEHNFYTVEIPDDNGTNYLGEWKEPTVFDAADTEVMRRKTGFGDTKFSDGKREQKSQVATTIADMKQRVTELFEKAKTGEFVGKPASIGRLSVDGKAYLEKLSDLKFKEFVDFVLNPSDLNHIRSDHYGENEKDKGNNVPLTDEDIQNMVDVLNQPDGILYGVDKKDGRKLFFFLKNAGNGLYNLTEVCSTKKGNLTAKSFFKSKKKGISQRVMEIKDSLLPTSVTYSGEFLSSDAKIPTLFEINKDSSKNVANDGLLFRDGADTEVTRKKTGFGDTKFSDGNKKSAKHGEARLNAFQLPSDAGHNVQPSEAAPKHLKPTETEHDAKVLQNRENAKEALANVADIVYPIVQNGTLKWVNKEKGLTYLSFASRYVQQEIDKQDLDTATKVVKDFVNPKISDENVADEGAMFRDGDIKLEETITKMKVEASQCR